MGNYEVSEFRPFYSAHLFCKSNSPHPLCKSNRRIARQRKQSMLVNFLLKRKMTFFIWTLGLCWEADVANSGNTSNNHLRDTEHQPNRAMRLLFSNAYPPAQIQECRSSKIKTVRFMCRKLEQAAMSKLIEMAYKKQRLSDDTRACNALRSCFPDMLRDITFSSCLRVYTIQEIVCLCDKDHQPIFAVKLIWISWSKLRSCYQLSNYWSTLAVLLVNYSLVNLAPATRKSTVATMAVTPNDDHWKVLEKKIDEQHHRLEDLMKIIMEMQNPNSASTSQNAQNTGLDE
ncbi:hypothetical protein POM88_029546 [Heracleum sosnowskyi]|uniref:Uncharacterized protein n=1 Tax=Heracleum sosnowskyi TaxID=360622 RepID=A0AAD8MIK7_9APIA|nr:hypothetical protein POM88_029546 [Heracleum sosnowskyi]